MSRIEDAGHGGKDPGAVAKGNTEKVYTLEAAQYVARRLKEHGIQSDLTRNSDVTLDQTPRTNKVKGYKHCNSHHYNAGGGSGAEVLISIHANPTYANMVIDEFRKAGYPVRPKPVIQRKGANGKDYYYMHLLTGACETTIIEYDFVDGPQAEKIKNKAYREGMYECVIKAVCRFEGVTYKSVKKAEDPKPTPTTKTVFFTTGGYRGPALTKIHDLLIANNWWFEPIRNDGGALTFRIGGFAEGSEGAKRLETFLKENKYYYKIQ